MDVFGEGVSAKFVYLDGDEHFGMHISSAHHEMLEDFQKCCYGDKYLADRILHSNDDVSRSSAAASYLIIIR